MKNKLALASFIVTTIGLVLLIYSLYDSANNLGYWMFGVDVVFFIGLILGIKSLKYKPKILGIVAIILPILFAVLYLYYVAV